MTLQDKLAAIQWPKDIERIGAYHVYRGKYYGTLDDGQSAKTQYQTDCATAALALLAVCREWIESTKEGLHWSTWRQMRADRDALLEKLREVCHE